jgi:hypothetical protein
MGQTHLGSYRCIDALQDHIDDSRTEFALYIKPLTSSVARMPESHKFVS